MYIYIYSIEIMVIYDSNFYVTRRVYTSMASHECGARTFPSFYLSPPRRVEKNLWVVKGGHRKGKIWLPLGKLQFWRLN